MPDERDNSDTPQEEPPKPTITIAEKQGSSSTTDEKPTITIAEKQGGGQ